MISLQSRDARTVALIDVLLYDVNTFMDFVQANKQGLATVMFWDMCEAFRSLCDDGKVLEPSKAPPRDCAWEGGWRGKGSGLSKVALAA